MRSLFNKGQRKAKKDNKSSASAVNRKIEDATLKSNIKLSFKGGG